MTEVGGIGRAGGAAAVPARVAAGPVFAMPQEPSAAAAAATPGAAAAAVSLSGLLALQGAGPEAPRDRTARRRGRDILDALAALQRGLLGGDAGGALARLASLIEGVPLAADPRLAALLAAVALRARIELARRGTDAQPVRAPT